jgi:hypothetical protein
MRLPPLLVPLLLAGLTLACGSGPRATSTLIPDASPVSSEAADAGAEDMGVAQDAAAGSTPSVIEAGVDRGAPDLPASLAEVGPPVEAAPPIEARPPVEAGHPDAPGADAPGLPDGTRCTSQSACRSGFCVDGVCCNMACTVTCAACNVPGLAGSCSLIPEGTDPDNECGQEPHATCKQDGMCNGLGACRLWPAGSECAAGTCTGTTEWAPRICDGHGTCNPATSRTCPQACAGGICPAPCGPASPCPEGLFCDQTNNCRPRRGQGQPCQSADDCGSTYCVDGVCCASACTGTCQACNLAGSEGRCLLIPAGQDPNQECPADPAAPCGRAGGCSGTGACRLQPEGAPCGGSKVCAGITESERGCNGFGTCVSFNPRNCTPYRCAGNACGETCLANYDCAPGHVCSGGSCTAPDGGP